MGLFLLLTRSDTGMQILEKQLEEARLRQLRLTTTQLPDATILDLMEEEAVTTFHQTEEEETTTVREGSEVTPTETTEDNTTTHMEEDTTITPEETTITVDTTISLEEILEETTQVLSKASNSSDVEEGVIQTRTQPLKPKDDRPPLYNPFPYHRLQRRAGFANLFGQTW